MSADKRTIATLEALARQMKIIEADHCRRWSDEDPHDGYLVAALRAAVDVIHVTKIELDDLRLQVKQLARRP